MIIQSSDEIKARVKDVYALAKSAYFRPDLFQDIKSIKVIEESADGTRIVSEWVGFLKEYKTNIKWTAEDVWDDQANTCRFSVVKGDFYTYSGQFTFTDLGDRTRLDSVIEIESDLPRLGNRLTKIIAGKIEQNLSSLVEAVKAEVET